VNKKTSALKVPTYGEMRVGARRHRHLRANPPAM